MVSANEQVFSSSSIGSTFAINFVLLHRRAMLGLLLC